MPAGRPSLGPKHAQSVEASPLARRRLELILATLNGETTIVEACEELGINEARFHVIRKQALQAAAERLEPKRTGRPPRAHPASERIAQLEAELRRQATELKAAQIRAELALAMPGVLQPADPPTAKKKRREKDGVRCRLKLPRRRGKS